MYCFIFTRPLYYVIKCALHELKNIKHHFSLTCTLKGIPQENKNLQKNKHLHVHVYRYVQECKSDLRINKDFTDFFQAVRVSTHYNNVMRHVVIIFGIYSHKKLSKSEVKKNIINNNMIRKSAGSTFRTTPGTE